MSSYQRMARSGSSSLREQFSIRLVVSYAFDWIVLIALAAVSFVLGNIEPNKRPFSLVDPNIAFPYTEHETVPAWLLAVLCGAFPVVVIAIVALIFVPGATVPKDTPKTLIWKRKLWELHVGWLGLLMSVAGAWFFVSAMKNMFGKPRPDLLSRCQPDLANAADYVVGGFANLTTVSPVGTLYSGDICKQADKKMLDDGFRSYPSGHSAASAAGLIYLSLFLASKFAVNLPFVVPGTTSSGSSALAAFPSRVRSQQDSFSTTSQGDEAKVTNRNAHHNSHIQSVRRQAAAPPVYLLIITLIPFCVSIFIAASRWFDFRHHGFDILFGFLIGIIAAFYSFRYYHLSIRAGAGWAWGARSKDRAFWAGVGRLGYAGEGAAFADRVSRYDAGESADIEAGPSMGTGVMNQRNGTNGGGSYDDVELQRLEGGRI